MYKPEMDAILTRHLGRVTAPEELWQRIQNPQSRRASAKTQTRMYVPFAVAAMVLIAALVYHPRPAAVEYHLPAHNLTLQVSKPLSPEALTAACQRCHTGA